MEYSLSLCFVLFSFTAWERRQAQKLMDRNTTRTQTCTQWKCEYKCTHALCLVLYCIISQFQNKIPKIYMQMYTHTMDTFQCPHYNTTQCHVSTNDSTQVLICNFMSTVAWGLVLAGAGCLREMAALHSDHTHWASWIASASNRVWVLTLVTPHVLACENAPRLS